MVPIQLLPISRAMGAIKLLPQSFRFALDCIEILWNITMVVPLWLLKILDFKVEDGYGDVYEQGNLIPLEE